jgi:hypothetical protein
VDWNISRTRFGDLARNRASSTSAIAATGRGETRAADTSKIRRIEQAGEVANISCRLLCGKRGLAARRCHGLL